MLLDYKDIIIKHYALGMSGREIAEELSVSKSGVNKFLAAFKECKTLSYPLPEGITNYGIAAAVYGQKAATVGRDLSYEMPDYEAVPCSLRQRLLQRRPGLSAQGSAYPGFCCHGKDFLQRGSAYL